MEETSALAQSIVRRLLMLFRYQHRFAHQVQRDWGISGRQLSALRYLVQDGPHSVSEISRYLYIGDGTTSPMLERMENAGLVERRRCSKDARRVLVEATEKGRRLIEEAPLGLFGQLRKSLPNLAPEELQALDRALERLMDLAQLDESLLE